MEVLECNACGYIRTSEQEGFAFYYQCVMCSQIEEECFCEISDLQIVCSRCI